jgi:DNA-binding beta-propeller fold protein YncE
VITVTGFGRLVDFVYDGSNMWVTDQTDNTLKKLDANGNVLQSVMVGTPPYRPVYDGKNIWVPTGANTVDVVRASTGEVLATLSGNGLNAPRVAAFDGERILVTNFNGDSVSLWKATDLTPLGSLSTTAGTLPFGACTDGQSFWVVLEGTAQLARF